jgi:steroid delta-isomerase-like uncharacterized protein
MSEQSLIDAAKAPIIAYNQKDWEAARSAMTSAYVYDEVGTQRKMQGADEVIAGWHGWATAFPDSAAEFNNALVSGNTVVLELTWRGTHTGPLQTPGGTVAPTGKRFEFGACQVTEVADGKAQSTRHYFDMTTLLRQLGVGS